MALAPIWRVASAANTGSGAAVRGRRHVLPSRGTVVDWRKGRFTPWAFPLIPEGKENVHTALKMESLYKDNTIYRFPLTQQPKKCRNSLY